MKYLIIFRNGTQVNVSEETGKNIGNSLMNINTSVPNQNLTMINGLGAFIGMINLTDIIYIELLP